MKKLLRPDEVALLLNVHVRTVYRRIREGFLVTIPVGKRAVRITAASLRAYLVSQALQRAEAQGMPRNEVVTEDDRQYFIIAEENSTKAEK